MMDNKVFGALIGFRLLLLIHAQHLQPNLLEGITLESGGRVEDLQEARNPLLEDDSPDFLIVSQGSDGMVFFELDPDTYTMTSVMKQPTVAFSTGLYREGDKNYVIVVRGNEGVVRYEVGDFRTSPLPLRGELSRDELGDDGFCKRVYVDAINPAVAYLGCKSAGVKIISLENPSTLSVLGTWKTDPADVEDLTMHADGVLMVSNGNAGVHLVSVSDPQNPTTITSLATSGFCKELSRAGSNHYVVADGFAGVKVIGIIEDDMTLMRENTDFGSNIIGYSESNRQIYAAQEDDAESTVFATSFEAPTETVWSDMYPGRPTAVATILGDTLLAVAYRMNDGETSRIELYCQEDEGCTGGNIWTEVTIALVAILVLCVVALVSALIYKKRRGKKGELEKGYSFRADKPPPATADPLPSVGPLPPQSGIMEGKQKELVQVENIKIISKVAKGGFGEVYYGEWDGAPVALKKISGGDMIEFEKEAVMLSNLSHPHIVTFHGIYISPEGESYIVTEFLAQGSLLDLLYKEGQHMTYIQLLDIIVQSCQGMVFLAGKSIVHRDLAARNLLVSLQDGKYRIKISDFGLARTSSTFYQMNADTKIPVKWSAIEILKGEDYTHKSDVWSFAVLMWEILERGAEPFSWVSNREVFVAITKGERLPRPNDISDELWKVMEICWSADPEDRPSFPELLHLLQSILNEAVNDAKEEEGEDGEEKGQVDEYTNEEDIQEANPRYSHTPKSP